ncbi:hypothetical protein [Mycolicibacterium mucogenicum]|uniref:Uncharacterized protein n=1 Tax=Mycolicibacterium mucogenicum DSM 44124 TaxID=1226753 RepID=A0A8H2JA61_MYCMU|nr:hypothetical protein [Mycolicibacterium mucogenicum]KAB7754242.1 hypothetical protein MMUC44124_22270 [Mycolicibacterium mucogenicum DSM 44124]QPG70736.1 hypothetical protein C1S78_007185 [Mycolicibacterium mucogenicum DSM 44124]
MTSAATATDTCGRYKRRKVEHYDVAIAQGIHLVAIGATYIAEFADPHSTGVRAAVAEQDWRSVLLAIWGLV